MRIIISNFLGIASATIPLPDKPVLIVGQNASGKTSAATAVAAVLTRTHNPLGLAVTKAYLRDGQDYGEVLLKDDSGVEMVRWILTEDSVREFAEAPAATRQHTTPLTDFIMLKPQGRVDLWEEVFLPPPAELVDLITKEVHDKIAREGLADEVLRHLKVSNWKGAEAVYKTKAGDAKRSWQVISGEVWGSKKGMTWTPTNWRSEFEGITPMEAESNLERSREALRTIQVAHAVTESQQVEADEAAKEVAALQPQYATLNAAIGVVNLRLQEAAQPFHEITGQGKTLRREHQDHLRQKPIAEQTTPCPDCGVHLVVVGRKLTKAADKENLTLQLQAWEHGEKSLVAQLDALRAEQQKVANSMGPLEQEMKALRVQADDVAQKLQLAKYKAGRGGTVVTEDQEAQAAILEQQKKDAEEAKNAITAKKKADEHHNSVVDYLAIAKTLGPRGIRGQAMKKGLDALDAQLQDICEATGWERVSLDAQYAVYYGRRVAVLCSESEKWLAQFSLRAALSITLGDRHLIADGADILDSSQSGRLQVLVNILVTKGIYPIICATTDPLDEIPAEWEHVKLLDGKGVDDDPQRPKIES